MMAFDRDAKGEDTLARGLEFPILAKIPSVQPKLPPRASMATICFPSTPRLAHGETHGGTGAMALSVAMFWNRSTGKSDNAN